MDDPSNAESSSGQSGPEEPDPMHWVLGELETEFEAGLRREQEQEVVQALRAQVGQTPLWVQLARRGGIQVVVWAGGIAYPGTLVTAYPDFCAVTGEDGTTLLVRLGSSATIAAAPQEPEPLPPAPTGKVHWTFALALRELARRREPVRMQLEDQSKVTGTIEAVGSDYVELAEHDPGEARRRPAIRARRYISLNTVTLVSSLLKD